MIPDYPRPSDDDLHALAERHGITVGDSSTVSPGAFEAYCRDAADLRREIIDRWYDARPTTLVQTPVAVQI
ncbi:MAG: hypothetical protein M3P30_14780 [Chloroflexota bacterium]|nr:hypothetical protein [Chloroflexota bacterium]